MCIYLLKEIITQKKILKFTYNRFKNPLFYMLSFFGASFFHKTNVFETWRISAEYEACFSSSSGEGIKSCCDQNKTLHPSSLWHYIYFTKIRIRNIIHGYKSDLMHASIRPNFFFSSSTTLLYLNVTKK